MNRYIADCHFNHKAIISFDSRPFLNVNSMNRAMIQSWNFTVNENDDIYIVGDLIFEGDMEPAEILKALKGKKHLIIGNHDSWMMQDNKLISYFESVDKYMEIEDDCERVVLCHYPILEWNGYYRGTWQISGHIHLSQGKVFEYIRNEDKLLNAGAVITMYRPVTLKELIICNQPYKRGELFRKSIVIN